MASPLRCQQTLGPLTRVADGLRSESACITYPTKHGYVFMGYDPAHRADVKAESAEEREHQTTALTLDRDLAFMRRGIQLLVPLIYNLRRLGVISTGARLLEIGAGSGWPAWLFAAAGCEVWTCELEPDSAFVGKIYEHANWSGRVVCDATLLPFANESFDVVLAKEFVHHVREKLSLFQEVNRVLAAGGSIVTMDPARSLQYRLRTAVRPDPMSHHSIVSADRYARLLRGAGFAVRQQGTYLMRDGGRFRLVAKERARVNAAWRAENPVYARTLTALIGGGIYVLAEKQRAVPRRMRPGRIEIIDPSTMTFTESDWMRYRPFYQELLAAAELLQ
jgi:SAM-dependent methyltransferase